MATTSPRFWASAIWASSARRRHPGLPSRSALRMARQVSARRSQVEPDVRGDVVLLDVAVDAVRVPGDAEPAPMIDVGPLPEG
jgi:hypothetical protein